MKKQLLMLAAAMSLAVGASAQNFSTLNWNREISEAEFDAAYKALDESNLLGTSLSAQYALRGGKENTTPQPHSYQMQWCLHLDNYAGYFVVTHFDFPYSDDAIFPSTYALCERFDGAPRYTYTATKNCFDQLLLSKDINSLPEVKAVNLLYYCLAAQELADISGPFTYEEDKQGVEEPTKYNDLRTIYYGIVADLDNIVACLKNFPNRPAWYKNRINDILNNYDTARDGIKSEKFVEACWRLANSIKLRMAMHMVKVEPDTAREWAESAVASGVIESEEMQSGIFTYRSGTNPYPEICNKWNDNRLNASFETLMAVFDHPYAKFLFEPNANIIEDPNDEDNYLMPDEKIIGIRAGARVGEGQTAENQYNSASTFESLVGFMESAPLYFVKWAEVDFLRAEGAIRNWHMLGKAKDFYERGIRNACLDEPKYRKWYEDDGVKAYDYYVEDYMKLEKALPYTQVDPFGDGEDWVSPITIGVKWNDADNLETKLEKIITQKWFALFPNLSGEAWTEVRRTGYPSLIPVLNPSDGDGSLVYGDLIRRIPWIPTDEVGEENVKNSAIPALGGPDLQATRLWWDVDTKGDNFTAVSDVKADANTSNEIYDLSGRKAGSLKSGLYISNGKKFVVK